MKRESVKTINPRSKNTNTLISEFSRADTLSLAREKILLLLLFLQQVVNGTRIRNYERSSLVPYKDLNIQYI